MKASTFLAKYLESQGVTHVFELVGGMITHIIDSINIETKINIVSCHHEQSAGFAAEGYARNSGIPGVALATSGPGATNLITAIGSCYFDSVPTVFITGQVNTYELKKEKKIRQLGFQETDIISIVKPLCKKVFQVERVEDLPHILEKSFEIALEGRQGPCLIDFPMNVQSESLETKLISRFFNKNQEINSNEEDFKKFENKIFDEGIDFLKKDIFNAKKPIILAGGGCSNFKNRGVSKKILKLLNLPVVMSLLGVDILPYDDPLRVGFIGSYGNRWANKLLAEADLLITIGSRLDIKQTGSDLEGFCKNKKIWQIEIDENEVGLRINPDNFLHTSLHFFEHKIRNINFKRNNYIDSWFKRIDHLKLNYPAIAEYLPEIDELNPIFVLEKLSLKTTKPKIFVTDVGQHQMWSAQSLKMNQKDRFITSGGMGAMGFGLPAAIGSYFAGKGKDIFLITGDGSFQLNIQELQTIKRNNIPIKIILFNNNCHGMVRQFQESYFKGNNQSTVKGYSAPNFVEIVNAYGIKAYKISSFEDIDDAIGFLCVADEAILIEFPLSVHSKVYPKLAFGKNFGDMEPEIKPTQMEST